MHRSLPWLSLLLLLCPVGAEELSETAREHLRRQAAEVEALGLIREAESAAKQGDFDASLARLREAESALRVIPPGAPSLQAEEDRIAALREAWEKSARERRADEARSRLESAGRDLARESSQERSRRQAAFQSALARYEDALSRSRFTEAEHALDDAQAIDPAGADIAALRGRLSERRHARARETNRASLAEEWRNLREFTAEQAIPYAASILRYPEHWNRLMQGRQGAMTDTLEQEEAWRVTLREKLARKVRCAFDQTPFPEAVAALENLGETRVVVDPSAREKLPDLDTLKVSFRSPEEGMSLAHTLDWLVRGTGLAWMPADEGIRITSPEKSQDAPLLVRHDVRDVLGGIPDSPGPKMTLGGGQAKGIQFAEESKPEDDFKGDDLLAFIKERVQPSAWNDPQNSIAYRNGSLLVNAPPSVQRSIRGVLEGFRQQRTLQVLIQTRFITLNDISFENIGVDWKGLTGAAMPAVSDLTPDSPGAAAPTAGFQNPRGLRTEISGAVADDGQFLSGAFPRSFNGSPTTNGGLGMTVAFLDTFQAQAVIQAVEKSTKSNLLTAPTILCYNTQRANLVSVVQQAYIQGMTAVVQVAAVGYNPEIGYVQTGIVFDVRPIVSADRKYVTLELRPTISQLQALRTLNIITNNDVDAGGIGGNVFVEAPVVQMQAMRASVSVPDGGTLMIGGLTNSDETHNYAGVPFLSKIPFLQALFSTKADARNRQSLVILAKVQIVDPKEAEEARFGKE